MSLVGKSHRGDSGQDSRHFEFFANVHANLAMVYENTGQLAQAIPQYQRALELMPTKPSLHQGLAGAYWKKRLYTGGGIALQSSYCQRRSKRSSRLQTGLNISGPRSFIEEAVFSI